VAATAQLKALAEQLTQLVAEMEAMEESVPEGEVMSEEDSVRLADLDDKATKVRSRIEFFEKRLAKEGELRAVLNRCAPAVAAGTDKLKSATGTDEQESRAMGVKIDSIEWARPKAYGSLRAFKGPDAEQRALRAGMHIRGYILGDTAARQWCIANNVGQEMRAQSSSINDAGGVLVTPEFSNEVIRLVEEYGVIPTAFKRTPMGSESLFVRRRISGLTARPLGESQAPSSSDIKYNSVELTAKAWGHGNVTPNSLIEDSPISMADELVIESSLAFAKAFDEAGFIGDGTSTYNGVEGITIKIVRSDYSKSVVTAATGHNTFGTLDIPDFVSVVSRLPQYVRQPKWYISPAGYGTAMLRLMAAAGGNAKADIAGGFPDQFMGYPVVKVLPMVSDLTSTGGKVLALFGDLTLSSTFGERRSVSLKTDTSRYVELDQTYTFATTRVAIVTHDLGSTTEAGPVIALKAAA
jgi:HK97 family phage major capsid protein